jgi:hypothetical protein
LLFGKAKKYSAALEKIRDEEGHVCENFLECNHASCDSSYAAWAYADAALSGYDVSVSGWEKEAVFKID